MVNENLRYVVNRISNLPTLPVVITKLLQVVENPNSSAADVSRVISVDQALMTKVLKVVNSAFYGLPKKTSTLTQATVILGFNTIKNLALSATLFDTFSPDDRNGFFDRRRFWEHSIGCAVATKVIARYCHYDILEEAFIAGLIHDIGKVVVDQFLHDDFIKIIERVKPGGKRMLEAEKEVLGVGHPEIGEWLAQKWNLPPHLVDAIVNHHNPGNAVVSPKLVAMVHLADALVRWENIGFGGDYEPPNVVSDIWQQIKLSESVLEKLVSDVREEYERANVFLDLMGRG